VLGPLQLLLCYKSLNDKLWLTLLHKLQSCPHLFYMQQIPF
jgi:hypothetical protein